MTVTGAQTPVDEVVARDIEVVLPYDEVGRRGRYGDGGESGGAQAKDGCKEH
jgi:hypothetical protein